MPRPRIRPVSAEAAATGQAALDSLQGEVFIPEGAASFPMKGGRTGRRWSVRLHIEKARVDVGGTKAAPDEDEAVYYLMTKALPVNVDPDKAVPVGTIYHLRIRVNYAKLEEGDEMAARNQAVLTTLFSALGTDVKAGGITEEVLDSAFPVKESTEVSTLAGSRLMASLSFSPPQEGAAGTGFLNVDRFLPDVE